MSQRLEKPQQQPSAADREALADRRLTELLMANAVRIEQPTPPGDVIARPGTIKTMFAIMAVMGLMVVAYVYAALFDREMSR